MSELVEQKKRKNTRQDIMELAMKLYEDSDYDSIQMDELAATLGISHGTVFYHFPTKQTLFYEIYNYHFCRNIEDNLLTLATYGTMQKADFRAFMLYITQDMFDRHFNMLRLVKIHSMTLDKGVDIEKLKSSLTHSMQMYEHFIEELARHVPFFQKPHLLQIFSARSAIVIGCFYMIMEPKGIDETQTKEDRDRRRKIFRSKVMNTFGNYLDGRLMKID